MRYDYYAEVEKARKVLATRMTPWQQAFRAFVHGTMDAIIPSVGFLILVAWVYRLAGVENPWKGAALLTAPFFLGIGVWRMWVHYRRWLARVDEAYNLLQIAALRDSWHDRA